MATTPSLSHFTPAHAHALALCRRFIRRVYDALNVLEALDIIAKDKKSVSWRGFPDTHCSRDFLEQERTARQQRVAEKEYHLRCQLGKLIAARQLLSARPAHSWAAGTGRAGCSLAAF